jgi:hypothetical protein
MPGESYLGRWYLGGEVGEESSGSEPAAPGQLAGTSVIKFTSSAKATAPPEPAHSPALVQRGAVEKLQPGRYMLRHIAPQALLENEPGIFEPMGKGFVVLGQTLYAEALPQLRLPDSPDFHEGKYTLRMFDAGDLNVSFPNRDASDGQPWRDRFSTAGHLEFLEISRESEVEQVGVLVKQTADRQSVSLEGYDGLFLLKKAFEQEWTGIMAPRDVIERYSGLWVVTLGDAFLTIPASEAKWELHTTGSSAASFTASGISLTANNGEAQAQSTGSFSTDLGPWSVRMQGNISSLGGGGGNFHMFVIGGLGNYVELVVNASAAALSIASTGASSVIPLSSTLKLGTHTFLIECDGRYVSAYIDGQLVGVLGGFAPTVPPQVQIAVTDNANGAQMTVEEVVCKSLEPLLMRGPEKGDYVLPGTAATYPTGGLHGRWRNYGGSGEPAWFERLLAPDPRAANFPTFLENVIPKLEGAPAQPTGVAGEFYAAQMFGAIYLDLEHNPEILIKLVFEGAARVWIGQTQFGQQIIDAWKTEGSREVNVFVKASVLGARKGWFPIIIEYAYATGEKKLELYVFPTTAGWTDPGGTTIVVGPQIVPTTSLSPLGCVDARIQGSSHFDTVIETARNFGYELRCEARQLESGEFPGRLVPKARLGKDTDEIIEAGDIDRRSEMGTYSATLDATDAASSVKAFGSGIADGKGSQIAFEALSVADEANTLFDIQAWVSAGDIAFPELLAARAATELALRRGPWENIEGEPIARDRLADTFPLTGAMAAFHWQPGDGVRLWLPDVSVVDTSPRQILQVVRSFSPEGRTGTQIGFRARPKDPLYVLRQALRDATRNARAYQHQYAPRVSNHISASLGSEGFSEFAIVALSPADRIVDAQVILTLNTTAQTTVVEINGVDRTVQLGGPWKIPASISILPFAVPASPPSDQRLYVRVKNTGGVASVIEFQVVLTLLV